MRLTRPRKKPHRCMRRDEHGRRYLARRSFCRGDPKPCPACGSVLHWRDETKHRRRDRARETCRDGCCPILYPHSVYSAECVNNPRMETDITGEFRPRRIENGAECPF